MKTHFAIFLCIVIGYVCVDSQRVEIGEDDSEADQDARKAASLDADETITEDQAIRPKDLPTSTQSSEGTSNKTEDSEKPSSAAKSISMTSEVKKSEQETQLGKPANDLGSILKHSHGNISANSTIGDKISLPRTSFDKLSCNTSGPLTLEIRTKWQYRRIKAEFSAEGKAELARRKRTAGGIEGLEDFNTYGIISQEIKGCFEVPRSTEAHLISNIAQHICEDAQILLVNAGRDYWKEINNLSQTDYFQPGSSAAKYMNVKLNELNLFGAFPNEMYERLLAEQAAAAQNGDGATEETMKFVFQCFNEERDTRFESDLDTHEAVFVFFLCIVIGIFTLLVYTDGGLNDRFAKENARRKMGSLPRVEQI